MTSRQDRKTVVAVLGTGGTIAQAGSRMAERSVESLLASLPAGGVGVDLRVEQVFQVVSPDITPVHWLVLARRVAAFLADPDVCGVVVSHGTDTLEETAYVLDLTVRSPKPVVLVGAMRASHAPGADGPRNLQNAIAIAASPAARNRGVLVTLNDRIDAARDVTKVHTLALDAFQSPDAGPLGHVTGDGVAFRRTALPEAMERPVFPLASLDAAPAVEIVYGYAGVGSAALEGALAGGARGLVFAGTGAGGIPTALHAALRDLRARNVVIVRASRINRGPVARNAEVDDDALDLVAAGTLNPQKARVLLMLALTRTTEAKAIQHLFDTC